MCRFLAAALPWLSKISKLTFWPFRRSLKPAVLTAEKWTKTSAPPSVLINPWPFDRLNDLTVPVVIIWFQNRRLNDHNRDFALQQTVDVRGTRLMALFHQMLRKR
jgi:hypothetical protein